MAELVEGARLEIVLTVKGYEGSNPSLSAIKWKQTVRMDSFLFYAERGRENPQRMAIGYVRTDNFRYLLKIEIC